MAAIYLARRGESYRGLAEPVKMEHRVVGVHGDDGIQIVLRPGDAVTGGQLLGCFDAHRIPSARVRPNVTDSRPEARAGAPPRGRAITVAPSVLNAHLDGGGPDAWRAALRIFEHQYGRAPEQPDEPFVMPTTVEEVEKLSWGQLLFLAGEHADDLGINGTGSPSLSP